MRPVIIALLALVAVEPAGFARTDGPRQLIGLLSSRVLPSSTNQTLHSYSTAVVFADGSFLASSANGASFESPFVLTQGVLTHANASAAGSLSSLIRSAEAAHVPDHGDCSIDNPGVNESYTIQWHPRSGQAHTFHVVSRNPTLPSCEPEVTDFIEVLSLYIARPKPASARIVVQ